MKKVEIIVNSSAEAFENCVNDFIEEHDVVDIQFRPTSDKYGLVLYSAMIIYYDYL